jgi:hypothetical protein
LPSTPDPRYRRPLTEPRFQLPKVYAWSLGYVHLALETYPTDARLACTGQIEPADKFATDPALVDLRPRWCEKCRVLKGPTARPKTHG